LSEGLYFELAARASGSLCLNSLKKIVSGGIEVLDCCFVITGIGFHGFKFCEHIGHCINEPDLTRCGQDAHITEVEWCHGVMQG
jgi:hypothetical protein